MSELDKERRTRLVREISDYQTFITCTDESDLELEESRRIYHVHAPEGKAVLEETGSGPEIPKLIFTEPDFT